MYYKVRYGKKYIRSFPEEWLMYNIKGTGPNECANCEEYGCIDKIFIGYCKNCAEIVYYNKRGDGFDKNAEEDLLEGVIIQPNYLDVEKYNIINYLVFLLLEKIQHIIMPKMN